MSDDIKRTDKPSGTGGRKTLTLKSSPAFGARPGGMRTSRTVVVEKRTRRLNRPGTASAQPHPQGATPPPKPAPAPTRAPERPGPRPGGLTAQESSARERALLEAAKRSVSEKREAEENDRRRAEEDARRRSAREEAERITAEAAATADAERVRVQREEAKTRDALRARAEPEPAPATKRPGRGPGSFVGAEELERARRAARPTPTKKPVGGDRRKNRLTVTTALQGDRDRAPSLAAMRRRREKQRGKPAGPQEKISREVTIPEGITVQELANRMAERAVDVIKLLMQQDQMVTINDVLDADTADLIATEMGHTVKRVAESDVEEGLFEEEEDDLNADKAPRPPVVTIMGHVDHGKTSLLDAFRSANVAAGEAGGITQHIGAYQIERDGQIITFLDTPGHEAFTAMRARGAEATDIAVLVVAANDGVMPQTIESIKHAKAAGVPIIVAINKMDIPDADPTKVRNELLQHEVFVESLGGEVLDVEVSALKQTNLDKLLEAIVLQAELLELKAVPEGRAQGTVIEAKLDKGRGAVATVLVQRGKLKVGDIVVAGGEWAKVRALINDKGEQVKTAGPSSPVEVLGFSGVPGAGDRFGAVQSEGRAREITSYRLRAAREKITGAELTSLEKMMSQLSSADMARFPLVVKGDVQGSIEAISSAISNMGTDEVAAQVLLSGVGGITESDVTLASASNAVVMGFNVRANKQAQALAAREGVEIRYYNVIYNLVDDVRDAMSGLLSPERRETFIGNAEILEIFNITRVGKVAGCRVTEGTVERGAGVRLIRDEIVIHEGQLSTLKRFKEEVKEVPVGQECGMAFERYEDMRAGDVIECFRVEQVTRTLQR
ncbi:MAG: translation initiation factor IF-2 [Alphaproteobacteria bacterium]|nr:translation initiation factor IF-2 [Alphaproteobacteria bacterium]